VLDAAVPANLLEALGREARAAVGQQVRDPEGEGRERLRELGSDFEGERASAALLVMRLLKAANLTWKEVIREVGKPHPHHQPPPQQQRRPTPATVAGFVSVRRGPRR